MTRLRVQRHDKIVHVVEHCRNKTYADDAPFHHGQPMYGSALMVMFCGRLAKLSLGGSNWITIGAPTCIACIGGEQQATASAQEAMTLRGV